MRVRAAACRTSVTLVCGVVFLSGTVAAHGATETTGGATVPLVLATAVVGGLVAGVSGLRYDPSIPAMPARTPLAVAGVLIILGGSLLFSMATDISASPGNFAVAVLAGGAATVFAAAGDGWLCSCEADALSTAVFGHRLVEGLVLGVVLDAAGGVALFAGALVVGHAVVELAVVGRYYRHAAQPGRGLAAVVAITLGFVVSVAVGASFVPVVPATVEIAVLAATGCILLTLGVSEWRGTGVAVP